MPVRYFCGLFFLGLRANDFLTNYKADSLIQTLAEGIRVSRPSAIHIKGLSGSLDSVIFASLHKSTRGTHVIILHDKEEASYFLNDLQNLLGEKEIYEPLCRVCFNAKPEA